MATSFWLLAFLSIGAVQALTRCTTNEECALLSTTVGGSHTCCHDSVSVGVCVPSTHPLYFCDPGRCCPPAVQGGGAGEEWGNVVSYVGGSCACGGYKCCNGYSVPEYAMPLKHCQLP